MSPTDSRLVAAPRDFWSIPDAARVDALITRSHQRSLNLHRLDPSRGGPRVLGAGELREQREPLAPLLKAARSGMESLFMQIRDVGYVVMLTNAAGVAVEFIDNPSVERESRRAGLAAGGCWTEDQEGTCAVGLALIDRLPLTVHHGEHFLAANGLLTCSAAPIFDPDGRLRAVLDVSALNSPDDRRSQHLVLSMVHATARMIENADFLRQYEGHLVLRTSSRREFLEVCTEGLIAIDAGGRVVATNQRFRHDLGRSPESLNGTHVEDLFCVRHEALAAAARRAVSEPIALRLQRSGNQCFALPRASPRPPAAQRRHGNVPARAAAPERDALDVLAGLDAQVHEAVRKARRVIDKPIAVLLQGESGTGKEAFAKAIHAASARADAAFVALNCAAIPETLIESELFGHREGAFTGARAKGARGKIAQAHGGTLFLDEIGDMTLSLQTRLLRVLSEREVTPLGAERALTVDLQVICATHRSLDDLIASGEFRLDLYYRLNGVTLILPPLRERSDLAMLIDNLLVEEAAVCDCVVPELSAAARELLLRYRWPGNIRQLKNCLRTALALADGETIDVEHLPAEIVMPARSMLPPERLLSTSWTNAPPDDVAAVAPAAPLEQLLQSRHWNISEVARTLGVNRATVYRRMARHHIVAPNRRG